jgi:hypothetical protein
MPNAESEPEHGFDRLCLPRDCEVCSELGAVTFLLRLLRGLLQRPSRDIVSRNRHSFRKQPKKNDFCRNDQGLRGRTCGLESRLKMRGEVSGRSGREGATRAWIAPKRS